MDIDDQIGFLMDYKERISDLEIGYCCSYRTLPEYVLCMETCIKQSSIVFHNYNVIHGLTDHFIELILQERVL